MGDLPSSRVVGSGGMGSHCWFLQTSVTVYRRPHPSPSRDQLLMTNLLTVTLLVIKKNQWLYIITPYNLFSKIGLSTRTFPKILIRPTYMGSYIPTFSSPSSSLVTALV